MEDRSTEVVLGRRFRKQLAEGLESMAYKTKRSGVIGHIIA